MQKNNLKSWGANIPAGMRVLDVIDLKTEKSIAFTLDDHIRFTCGDGNYVVKLAAK